MRENQQYGVLTRSDTNRAVEPQKQARSLKFRMYGEEGLYFLCSKNKGGDQLCSYCTSDLRLCFRIRRLLLFSCKGSILCFCHRANEFALFYILLKHWATSSGILLALTRMIGAILKKKNL